MCFNAKRLFRLALGPVLMLISAAALAQGATNEVNMSPGVTEIGAEIYNLEFA